jgi:hypothetical protein
MLYLKNAQRNFRACISCGTRKPVPKVLGSLEVLTVILQAFDPGSLEGFDADISLDQRKAPAARQRGKSGIHQLIGFSSYHFSAHALGKQAVLRTEPQYGKYFPDSCAVKSERRAIRSRFLIHHLDIYMR